MSVVLQLFLLIRDFQVEHTSTQFAAAAYWLVTLHGMQLKQKAAALYPLRISTTACVGEATKKKSGAMIKICGAASVWVLSERARHANAS